MNENTSVTDQEGILTDEEQLEECDTHIVVQFRSEFIDVARNIFCTTFDTNKAKVGYTRTTARYIFPNNSISLMEVRAWISSGIVFGILLNGSAVYEY